MFIGILAVIYLANTGGTNFVFERVNAIPFGDKFAHCVLFGCLTLLVIIASQFRTFSIAGVDYYCGAVASGLFVIAEECSQAFIPSRTFDVGDLLADAIGIFIAIKIAQYIKHTRHTKAEK